MRNPFSGLFHARDKPSVRNAVSGALGFFFGGSSAGRAVNERSAMQTTVVYACVRVIAETVASLPLHVYHYAERGQERMYDHPLYRLLHDMPNPEMTSFVFRETLMTHLLLWGNAYAQIIRDGRARVVALYPLLPDRMTVDRDVSGVLYYQYMKDGVPYTLGADEMLHIPALGFDGIVGYSPIAVARNTVGLSIATEEYGSRFFSNGATPSFILTHSGTLRDPDKLREFWTRAYGGTQNAGKVAILEEGMRFDRISLPNNEAHFWKAASSKSVRSVGFTACHHTWSEIWSEPRLATSSIRASASVFTRSAPGWCGWNRRCTRRCSPRRRRALFCGLQHGRPSARRLQKPHGGLRHRHSKRLSQPE